MPINNETLQDDYEYLQHETEKDYLRREEALRASMTQVNPEYDCKLDLMLTINELDKQLKRSQIAFGRSLRGTDVYLDEYLPDNYWCVRCGKKVYELIQEAFKLEKEGNPVANL